MKGTFSLYYIRNEVVYFHSKLIFYFSAPVAVTTAKKAVVPPSPALANKQTKKASSSDSSDDDTNKQPAKVTPITTKKTNKSSSSSSSDSDVQPSANKKQPTTTSVKGNISYSVDLFSISNFIYINSTYYTSYSIDKETSKNLQSWSAVSSRTATRLDSASGAVQRSRTGAGWKYSARSSVTTTRPWATTKP